MGTQNQTHTLPISSHCEDTEPQHTHSGYHHIVGTQNLNKHTLDITTPRGHSGVGDGGCAGDQRTELRVLSEPTSTRALTTTLRPLKLNVSALKQAVLRTLEPLGWSLAVELSVPMDMDCHDGVQGSVYELAAAAGRGQLVRHTSCYMAGCVQLK